MSNPMRISPAMMTRKNERAKNGRNIPPMKIMTLRHAVALLFPDTATNAIPRTIA
jgi:hypothetical protein